MARIVIVLFMLDLHEHADNAFWSLHDFHRVTAIVVSEAPCSGPTRRNSQSLVDVQKEKHFLIITILFFVETFFCVHSDTYKVQEVLVLLSGPQKR